ncbi:MAG: extracellular solute-binding protein [Motiliproteus sp.]|nr:extracellular solute-binding protein [Motiliproteus sp.]MCW9052453.1 extracellular solute-binding protein [Motiliproteus sp.]
MQKRLSLMSRVTTIVEENLRRIIAACFALGLCLSLGVSYAGEQADKALAAVDELIASGEVTPGSALNLVVKQGNIANFLGRDHELRTLWEERTGVYLDISIMPQTPSLGFIKATDDVDVAIARNREFADLDQQQLIVDLAPLARRFDLPLSEQKSEQYILPEIQAFVGEKQVAIPAGGDIAVLYLRKDLLEDLDNQVAYMRRFGEPLKLPESWREYQQHLEFFHRPEDKFYGSLEQRDKPSGWMFWMPRYASQSFPNQYLFDREMNPLINSKQGVAATKSYLAAIATSPPEILREDNSYTYTLPLFANGMGYATIITPAGAKVFNLQTSKVKGKFIAVPMPGTRINNQINRRTTLIYGNNIVIPSSSDKPELAFLYAMWLTDPDVSVKALSVTGGFSGPYRVRHFSDPQLRESYTPKVLDLVRDSIDQVIPAGTGLPGDEAYIGALNHNLYRAANGEISAEQAMGETAAAWQQITELYGREKQIRRWLKVIDRYPSVELAH